MTGERWLTLSEAALRVGRTDRTIRAWIRDGSVTAILGRVRESEVVRTERAKRAARAQGRPKRPKDK